MFVAFKDLRFAKGRFALMGAVVVLITMLVGLLSGLTAGLAQQNVSAITGLPADQIAFGNRADEELSYSNSTITRQQWQEWNSTAGVASAEPLGISTTMAESGDTRGTVTVFGVEPGSRLVPGQQPTGDSAVVSLPAAEELGLVAGDSFEISGRKLTATAVDGNAWFSHTPVIWVSLSVWQELGPHDASGTEPTATVIALETTSDSSLGEADRAIGTRTVAKEDSLTAIGSYASENGSLQLMRGFLFAISALVVGAFFTVWTVQRSGDIAVLKALGASTRYLLRDALGQALVLLLAGTALGTALAAVVGAALSGSAVPFALSSSTMLGPAAVMVLLGALGAALSVRRITSVDPLIALGSSR